MKKIKNSYFIIGAIINGLLFLVIPDYYFWFLVLLIIVAIIFLAIVVVDILGKTKMWKEAIKWLGFGILSWGLGILAIVIRNYLLGYYSN